MPLGIKLLNVLFLQQDSPLALLQFGLSLIFLLMGLIGCWRWPVLTALSLLWEFFLEFVSQVLMRWLEAPWLRRACCLLVAPVPRSWSAGGQRYLQEARKLGIPVAAMAITPAMLNIAEDAAAISRLLPGCARINQELP